MNLGIAGSLKSPGFYPYNVLLSHHPREKEAAPALPQRADWQPFPSSSAIQVAALSIGKSNFQGLVDVGGLGAILGSLHLLLRVFLSSGFLRSNGVATGNGGSWLHLVLLLP